METALCCIAFLAMTNRVCADDSTDKPKTIQPAADAPQPVSPDESARRIRLPDGFRIDLIASEPLVQEPSCIAFDEHGRLFVCELHGYNIEGHLDVSELNKTGRLDRTVRRIRWELQGGEIAEKAAMLQFGVVKRLTDTDGDGRMDHAEVWADDLPPCYGVLPARGGVIVVCAPHILFLADRDGDGRPDHRETLFTGFRTRVLERGINNPRWGLDNWIYVGAGGDGGTITGPHLDGPVTLQHSDFRFRPDGSAIEPVSGRVGTFGLTLNDIGDRFPSTGGQPAMYALPLPRRYLERNPYVATPDTNLYAAGYNRGFRISAPHPWRVKRGNDPAWVKFYGARETNSNYFSGGCSNTYYGDVLFPEEYRGNVFYCEPSLNIVHRCVVTRDGAGYKGERAADEQESEFLASTDQWFRPMNLRVGPDGALYIVDMYREIIEDYSAIPRFLQQQYGLDKGSEHGRIWRLAPRHSKPGAFSDLSKRNDNQLVALLGSHSAWQRRTAQRLLIERKHKAAAKRLSGSVSPDISHVANIHAMHTLAGLESLGVSDIRSGLNHPHFGVRLHALRLSDRWLNEDDELASHVVSMVNDPDPTVRLQVAMTLGNIASPQAVTGLLEMAKISSHERWMDAAILSSSTQHAGELLVSLLQNPPKSNAVMRPLAATVAGRRDATSMALALAVLATSSDPIITDCLQGFVDGLSSGTSELPASPDGWAGVNRLLERDSERVRQLATALSSRVPVADSGQLKRIFQAAARTSTDADAPSSKRTAAVGVLAAAPFTTVGPVAGELLSSREPLDLQRAAITALSASNSDDVGKALLQNWGTLSPAVRASVLNAVLRRVNRLPALIKALEDGRVQVGELSDLQRDQIVATLDDDLADRARALFSKQSASKEFRDRLAEYRAALDGKRDPERGAVVFAKNCQQCHRIDKQGFDVGPNLGSTINRPNETILVDILAPSSRIEPEYRSYIVATLDGRVRTGILASESATSVTLLGEKGKKESILRKDIDVIKSSEVSLMPSNVHEKISPQDAANLIRFLRMTFTKKKTASPSK